MSYSDCIKWTEDHLLTCQVKSLTEHECMGCGLQRSFLLLLKGEFLQSLAMYPALIPMLVLFVFTGLHLRFKFESGAAIIKWNFILVAILIAANFFWKLSH